MSTDPNLDDLLSGHSEWFTPDPTLDLVLSRVVPVQPDRVWAAWTDPELLVKRFTPAPWTTPHAHVRATPGGPSSTVDGTRQPTSSWR